MSATKDAPTFAALDLGSNSFHMIVARREHGQLIVLDRLREMVRLAARLDADGTMSAEAKERALDCLARFGQRLRGLPEQQVRALGTNALRQAADARDFLLLAEERLGHSIEVISGQEEARLIYLGVAHGLAARDRRRLVVDIGGGSTEFIVGEGHEPDVLESVSVGCVNISERFFGHGLLTREAFKEAETFVALELRPIRAALRAAGWNEVVGSSGTVAAVRSIVQARGWADRGITVEAIKELRRALRSFGKLSHVEIPELSDARRPVFPGGVAVLSACFRNLGIKEMRVSDAALREGALYDLVGRIDHQDPREASVNAVAQRYGVDLSHAARVDATARALFDQVVTDWHLGGHRDMLHWTARLHEIGLSISHSQHHRHGSYLVGNMTLAGFSGEEQQVLATLTIAQRKSLDTFVFEGLPTRLVTPILRLSIVLRIAVLMHRSRLPDPPPNLTCEVEESRISLRFPPGWLGDHPLTEADLEREQTYLKPVSYELEFG